MARLPSRQDLGTVGMNASSRIITPDANVMASPYRALGGLGAVVGGYIEESKRQEDQYNLANAKNELLNSNLNQIDSLSKNPDFSKSNETYDKNFTNDRTKIAEKYGLSGNALREFDVYSNSMMDNGRRQIGDIVFKKETDHMVTQSNENILNLSSTLANSGVTLDYYNEVAGNVRNSFQAMYDQGRISESDFQKLSQNSARTLSDSWLSAQSYGTRITALQDGGELSGLYNRAEREKMISGWAWEDISNRVANSKVKSFNEMMDSYIPNVSISENSLKTNQGNQALALVANNVGQEQLNKWYEEFGNPSKNEISTAAFINRIPNDKVKQDVISTLSKASYNEQINSITKTNEFQLLDPSKKLLALNQLESIHDQQTSQARVDLANRMKNDSAKVDQGVQVDNPVTYAEYVSVMPLNQTPQQRDAYLQGWKLYESTIELQPLMQQFNSVSDAQGAALLNSLRPDANTEDFALKQERFNYAANKLAQIIKARNSDMIGFAKSIGQQVTDIDFSNKENLTKSLSQRVIDAQRLGELYKMPNYKVLSNEESSALSSIVSNSTYAEQSDLLSTIGQATGNDNAAYNALLNDVGFENPVFATAGNILNSYGDTAVVDSGYFSSDKTINQQNTVNFLLKGSEALKGNGQAKGLTLPSKAQEKFNELTSGLFVDDFSSMQTMYNSAMAYYVGRVVSDGNYSALQDIDNSLMKESVNAVIGSQSSKHNVRTPWGMDEDYFNQKVANQLTSIAKDNGWLGNVNNSSINSRIIEKDYAVSLFNDYKLIPSVFSSGLPDGRYLLKAGNGFLRGSNGELIEIDVLLSDRIINKEIPQ